MHDAQVIVLATPVFLGLMAIELVAGWRRGTPTYAFADTMNSIGLGMLSQVVGLFTKLFTFGVYAWVFEHARLATLDIASPVTWIGALLAYDFFYYWLHRAGHRVALFWAAHVVHHQSEEYNLSTALRQTGSGWIAGWLFYVPMALAGVPPLVFAVAAMIDLLYQFWVHTRLVGKLGWFDRWFCAPSNHRVHHAVDDVYLDRNYGGILIVWDRLFGTFQPELDAVPCHYGTRSPLQSWNPVWANLEVYAALAQDAWHARRWRDKVMVWFKPPGWRPADVAERFPKPPFVVGAIPRYAPPMGPLQQGLAAALFLGVLAATVRVLWNAHLMSPPELSAAAGGILLLLWGVGKVCERGTTRPAPRTDRSPGEPVA
jgi:sterol desaturase/sphingolipid hydroxylase (fatty acid hydroxylase superfamily)